MEAIVRGQKLAMARDNFREKITDNIPSPTQVTDPIINTDFYSALLLSNQTLGLLAARILYYHLILHQSFQEFDV